MVGFLWLSGVLSPPPSWADGWHNATLGSSSIDMWLQDVRSAIPGFAVNTAASGDPTPGKPGSATPNKRGLPTLPTRTPATAYTSGGDSPSPGYESRYKPGGELPAQLTVQQKAVLDRKARECLELLAFMEPKNIFPHEFPNFPMARIPEYRQAAKELLQVMGPTGTTVTVNQTRSELMNTSGFRNYGLHFHANYFDDLLELLGHAAGQGWLSVEDLRSLQEATSGQKTGLQARLAQAVQQVWIQAVGKCDLSKLATNALLEWARIQGISSAVKTRIGTELGERLPTASVEELVAAARVFDIKSAIGAGIERELGQRLRQAELTEVLAVASEDVPPWVKQAAQKAANRIVAVKELRDEMPSVAEFLSSTDAQMARSARTQAVKVVQRAAVPTWLRLMGYGVDDLNHLVWEQFDSRLQSGDQQLRADYVESQLDVLGNTEASLSSRRAATELLWRLRPQESAARVIELLHNLPQELQPMTDQLLKDLGRDNTAALIALVEQKQESEDRREKTRIQLRIRQLASGMATQELLDATRIRGLNPLTTESLGNEMKKRLPEAKLSEVLGVMGAKVPTSVKQAAAQQAAERTLTGAELRDQIPAVARFLKAADPEVARLAQTHVDKGMQAAAVPDYLHWLGQGSHELNEMIVEQIDRRLESADEQQRARVVESGISVLADENASLLCRQYALGLLRRLRPRDAVGRVIDLLPNLPAELQPMTGELLEELTGQDYGPKHGDTGPEVDAAVQQWRAWRTAQR
jgi:hypothetical protein